MTEEEIELIKTPYNITDPTVKLDPEITKKVILKQYDDPDHNHSSGEFNNLKDDAIHIPVVRLNNIVLMDEQIDQVKIICDDFLPKVHLSIKDVENVIKICDAPGFDNEINIVFTAPINGYYKKVSLLFYITKFEPYDEYIAYDGIFKLQSLNSHNMKQLGKDKLNTYKMLYEIAKENKLGFASTKQCEDIHDEKYRFIQAQTYVDFIKEELERSGLDEKSIFDAWVDIFGYIVMVNVHYVFTEKIEPQQLTIYTIYNGENMLNDDNMKPQATLVQRTLTNNITNVASTNLHFSKYEQIINNDNIYKKGSLNTNYYMTSPCEDNIIQTEQIQLIENSTDGENNSTEYEFSKSEFLGIEFEDKSTLFQKNIHNRFFDKIRSKKWKIELTNYNLGLERGTLVNIVFKEYNSAVIKTFKKDEVYEEDAAGVINPFLTGVYYIDSMEFEYVIEEHKIKQFIYVIRRGKEDKPIDKSTGPITKN